MLAALVNGLPVDAQHGVSIEERGLAYGDGVFETMLLRDGTIRFLRDHFARLQWGCSRLGIVAPNENQIQDEIAMLIRNHAHGIVKLIVTRGAGGRGYRSPESIQPTRLLLLYPPPDLKTSANIRLRWCDTRLSRNAQISGIKHLNRLEQVLAQNEWRDPGIDEGLMLDTEGEVVCATAGNVFAMIDGVLTTPDLRFSGVRGVMRQRVIAAAGILGIGVVETSMRPDDILGSRELFVTNAVRGIRSVRALDDREWLHQDVAERLAKTIEQSP